MATADRSRRPTEQAKGDTGEPAGDSRPRRTLASYPTYAEAERAVDWLSDQGFAVEHVAIVGKGLRSVEQVGALGHEVASGGRRDFVSDMSIAAERYEVQADEDVAGDAERVLAAMPGK